MSPRITSEQRAALVAHSPGRPVEVFDDERGRTFWLISPEDVPALWAEHIHAEIQVGLNAIERGNIVSWDPEAIKERARAAAQRSNDAKLRVANGFRQLPKRTLRRSRSISPPITWTRRYG